MSQWDDALPVSPMPRDELERWSPRLRKISHDLNNALVPAVAHVDLLRLKLGRGDAPSSLTTLPGHLDNARKTAQRASAWALRAAPARPVTWADVRFGLQQLTQQRGMPLVWEVSPPHLAALEGELASLRQVLQALVTNACDACAGDEQGTASGVQVVSAEGWQLRVRDRGPGCDTLVQAAAGEQMRHGAGHLGLGLPIAAALTVQLGGQLRVRNHPEGGFVAELRAIDPGPAQA